MLHEFNVLSAAYFVYKAVHVSRQDINSTVVYHDIVLILCNCSL